MDETGATVSSIEEARSKKQRNWVRPAIWVAAGAGLFAAGVLVAMKMKVDPATALDAATKVCDRAAEAAVN